MVHHRARMRWRLTHFTSFCFLAVVCVANHTLALERIVVAHDGRATPVSGFADALRIQVAGMAVVIEGSRIQDPAHNAVERMASELRRLDADFGLWVELLPAGEGGDGTVVVRVISRRSGRVEVVSAQPRPGVERTLALKVREVLDAAIQSRQRPTMPSPKPEPPEPRPVPPTKLRQEADSLSFVVETSGAGVASIDGDGGVQFGADLVAGLRIAKGKLALEPTLALTLLTPKVHNEEGRDLRVDTRSGRFELRGFRYWDGVGLGARMWLGADWLAAEGRAPDGGSGSESVFLSRWGVGPAFRLRLHPQLELSASIAAGIGFRRQRFSIRGEETLDVGLSQLESHIGLAAFGW